MLSIGKLAAGQAAYYLDQAHGRVDVVSSVGEGAEDYYLAPHEARGQWIGAGSRELGLSGGVEANALRAVLGGLDPRDQSELRSSTSRTRIAGFDLTFSASKSVSVLFGIGDDKLRGQVRDAHDLAVREAIGYLERSAAAVRRGHAGAIVEQASGLVAAAFRHRTSRAGDPQLHSHVLVANLGRGLDGRWSALDGRRLYAHARTASFLYQAVLRAELTRRVGLDWEPIDRGIAEVAGVPRQVTRAFSRRRADIEAALDERGLTGAKAAEAAALATRKAKGPAVSEAELAAGGAFRALVKRGLAGELSHNVRQVNAWERDALEHLRSGRAEPAIALYGSHEALVVAPTEEAARRQLVDDWLRDGDPDSCVMIAHRRADVTDLNARARAHLCAAGAVHGPQLELQGGAFATGDRVVLIKRNDRRLNVQNGERGRVVALNPATGGITLACGNRTVELDRRFLYGLTQDGDPTLLHGYAITGHVAQGVTVDRTFVLAGKGITREWAYVALSRGRLANRLYTAMVPDDPREEFAPVAQHRRDATARLAARLSESAAQVLAIDSGVLDLTRRLERQLDGGRYPGREL